MWDSESETTKDCTLLSTGMSAHDESDESPVRKRSKKSRRKSSSKSDSEESDDEDGTDGESTDWVVQYFF